MTSTRIAFYLKKSLLPFNSMSNNVVRQYTQIAKNNDVKYKLSMLHNRSSVVSNSIEQRCTIMSDEALGMDSFLESRCRTQKQHTPESTEEYFQRMRDQLEKSKTSMFLVFKQDLDKIIYLCEDNEDHIALLKEMVIRFSQQNASLRFGNFKFGPLVMRLCYVIQRPDLAMELSKVPELSVLFNDVSTYTVMLTLLYNHGCYTEVMDIMMLVTTGRLCSQRYPRSCILIALASALKQGTAESYQRGLELAESAKGAGNMQRRFFALAGTIALKADRPDLALTLLHRNTWGTYYTIRNILVLSWCQLGKLDQVMSLLRPMVTEDAPDDTLRYKKGSLLRQTYENVDAAVKADGDLALQQEWTRVKKMIMDKKELLEQDLTEVVLLPMEKSESTSRYPKFPQPRPQFRERGSILDASEN